MGSVILLFGLGGFAFGLSIGWQASFAILKQWNAHLALNVFVSATVSLVLALLIGALVVYAIMYLALPAPA